MQVGLQNHDEYSYLNKEYIPTIYLYDDNTFEFICNMYEYINTYTGSWMVTEDEALAEYRFMVENEPAIKNLDFYIMHNKSRCDAEFYTDYNEPMIYGMTSAEYENILFHFNE